ncbi:MAG: hypothetical protein C5B50_30080 [Verrucomicrobia bacterium]|nr:MAG: hypothetical protein C5B50_30080 [Verrucomicrobiota bacterium]
MLLARIALPNISRRRLQVSGSPGNSQFKVFCRTARTSLPTCLLAVGCAAASYKPAAIQPPAPVREYRAAWVATVENIDWPSRRDLSTAQQKAELVTIMERAQHLKLNAVIFQVRPACDAMYESKIEPWSEFLTGTMGKAPDPFYDPLAFAIAEAHKRGLELHAWFNPYRARTAGVKTPASANHISNKHQKLVRHYGKQLWLDPGEKEVQDYSLSVVMDVVKRYDVDGVHFDDYFYPYKARDSDGGELDFPDDASWQRFGAGGKLNRDDWRRENVNVFIERLYKSIKTAKPWVKFGISPFGIWKDGVPPQIKGYDAYSKLYADSRKWLASGWLDYFAPQLYWAIDAQEQSFPVLLKWWCEQNQKGRHLMPGLDTTKTADTVRASRKWKPEEIVNQIRLTRQMPGADGHIHWNMTSLTHNPAFDDALEEKVYSEPALIPASPWLGDARLASPKITSHTGPGSGITFAWSLKEGKAWLWLVQSRSAGKWHTEILPAGQTSRVWDRALPDVVAVTAVDRNGALGTLAAVKRAGTGD